MDSLRRALPWVLLFVGVFWVSHGLKPAGAFAVGDHLPKLSAELADGSRFSLEGAPGQVLVLNFWASYCAPCRSEAPLLSKINDSGVRVVGLSVDANTSGQAQQTARKLGMNYTIGVSDEKQLLRLRVHTIPTTYVLAPDGKIVLSRVGAVGEAELQAAVASAKGAG